MVEEKSKIFSMYYIKKDKNIIGPLKYEQLKEIMYNKKFTGNEKVSEDQETWKTIREILPNLDSFLSADQEELYNETFLNLINKKSEYKVKTTFNITMGPFNNEKFLNLIKQGKIEGNYEVILDDMIVEFNKIKKRLFNKIELILAGKDFKPIKEEKVRERPKKVKKVIAEDLEEMENIKSIDFSEISSFEKKPKIEIKKIKKLSEENIKGLLSTKPLLSLLFTYSLDKLTGLLEITRKSDLYEVSFKKGKLAYISSNRLDLSLPRYLKEKKNIITHYDETLADTVIIPKLISEKKIDASQIYDLLKELVMYRLEEIFKVDNGKFLFKQGVTSNDTSLNIDFLSHMWKFTSKLIPMDIVELHIKKIEEFVIIKDERKFSYNKYLKLGPTEFKLLNKINNKVTTKQFINALLKQKAEILPVFKKLIYVLYKLRFVQKGEFVSSKNILEEIQTLKSQILKIEKENNHFVTLGVSQDTPLSKIRKIYIKAAKDYHPDKLNKESNEELRELKTKYYTYISTAYNKISTQQKLEEYINELNSGVGETFDAESLFKSEELFNKCKKAVKVGKYERALEYVNEAITLFEDNYEFKVYLYYLNFIFIWQNDLGKAKSYLLKLETLMKEMEKYPDGYRFLGRMYKMLKDSSKAKLNFKKLYSLIPYDTEAKKEIR